MRRRPIKRAHGDAVASSLVSSELLTKVSERVERMSIVETFLIFSVTSFYLSVMTRSVGPD